MEEKSEYDKQTEKFLKDTDTEFKAEFLKNDFHFQDDKETRDIYLITLKRGEREFKFNFGQSLNNSDGETKPSAYDVLSGLTSSEVGDFKEFCSEFGYDEDSRKAEKTYNAVLNEWNNIKMLYTDEEILKLQEIN